MTCGGLQIAKPVKKNDIVTLKSILEFIYCLLAALYMRLSRSSAQPRLDLIKKYLWPCTFKSALFTVLFSSVKSVTVSCISSYFIKCESMALEVHTVLGSFLIRLYVQYGILCKSSESIFLPNHIYIFWGGYIYY